LVLEYPTGDGDHAVSDPGDDAVAGRPDEWMAPGVTPLGVPGSTPLSLSLAFTVTVDDMMASVLDHEPTRKRYEAAVWKAGWLRSWWLLALTLGLVLLANLFMFELDLTTSVFSALVLGVLFGLVRWSQIDHVIKRSLPAMVQRQSLHQLAERGDERHLTADATGVTLADAASSTRFGWAQVQLAETGRHVLLTTGSASWAIPKQLGEPLADLVRFARNHGVN
jgi:hypothetical protein